MTQLRFFTFGNSICFWITSRKGQWAELWWNCLVQWFSLKTLKRRHDLMPTNGRWRQIFESPPRPACLTYFSPYGNNVDTSFLVIEFWWLYPRPSLNTIQWRTQNAKWYFKAHIAQNEWTILLVIHGRIRKERALCWENSVNPDTGNLIVLKPLPRAVNSFCVVSKMSRIACGQGFIRATLKKMTNGTTERERCSYDL